MFIQLAIDLDILQQGVKQWGLASVDAARGYYTFTLPITGVTVLVAASLAYDAARADNSGPVMHGTLKTSNSSVQTGWYTADLTHKASGIGYIAFCKA